MLRRCDLRSTIIIPEWSRCGARCRKTRRPCTEHVGCGGRIAHCPVLNTPLAAERLDTAVPDFFAAVRDCNDAAPDPKRCSPELQWCSPQLKSSSSTLRCRRPATRTDPFRTVVLQSATAMQRFKPAALQSTTATNQPTTAPPRPCAGTGNKKSRIAAARKVLRNDGSGTRHAAFSSVARDRFTNRVPSESRKAVRPWRLPITFNNA